VVTDANGLFQIIDLRPGTYDVTFTLPGFSTIARKSLEVSGGGVTTVNAEMRVGGVQETITVTGESPVVDVQTSTSREQVLSNEFIRSLPAARGYGNYLAGVPGISGTGLSSGAATSNNFFTSRGGRSSEGNIQLDGMNVGSSVGGGGVSGYQYDMSNASEVQVTIAGGLAEVDRGGPAFNMIPKTGGNTFSGFYFGSIAGKWAQGDNLDDELRALGFTDLPALIKSWDTNFAFSGPILRNRIWFFANARTIGTYQDVPNNYGNLNAGNPYLWAYAKDESVKVRNANSKKIGAARLTWQASQRDKFGFYVDYTKNCSGSSFASEGGQCRAPRRRLDRIRSRHRPGRPDQLARIRHDLGRARENHAGHLFGAVVEQGAGGSRLLVVLDRVGRHPSGGRRGGSDSRDRADVVDDDRHAHVELHLSRMARHRRHDAAERAVPRVRVVRHRIAQPQGGLPGRLHDREDAHLRRAADRLPLQQRRAEPDHAAARPDAHEQPHRARRVLRAGHVDTVTPHAAGRPALRTRAQLLPEGQGVIEAHRFGPAIAFPRTEGVRGLNDITPRWADRTTCSATARRRSRSA
jgi:hypothetical protein